MKSNRLLLEKHMVKAQIASTSILELRNTQSLCHSICKQLAFQNPTPAFPILNFHTRQWKKDWRFCTQGLPCTMALIMPNNAVMHA